MIDDMNKAQREIASTREKLDDMESLSIRNLRRAKVNLLMGKVILAMETFLLIWTEIIVYMSMFYFFAHQSFPVAVGFWYLGIDVGILGIDVGISWIPAWVGYMVWQALSRQAIKRRTKLLEDQRKAEETHKRITELRKNVETTIQKMEALK